MRTTISKNENTFTLVMEYQSTYSCQVKVKVEHYRNDGQEYFDISYEYSFPEGQVTGVENMAHPFYQKTDMRHDTTGVIVFKNEVTEKLVKYLLLPDEELSNFTGTTTPKAYRRLMMLSLDMLWD